MTADIIGTDGDNVQIQYGDRTRVVDITDPELSTYFRFRARTPAVPAVDTRARLVKIYKLHRPEKIEGVDELLREWRDDEEPLLAQVMEKYEIDASFFDGAVEVVAAKPVDPDGLDEFDTGSSSDEDKESDDVYRSKISITNKDICEVYSKSSGLWQPCEVMERDGDELVVKYAGNRSRVVDLRATDLGSYFRVRKRRPEDFVVGDDVEVYSAGVQQWLAAEVVEIDGLDITVEYGDRQKIVSLESKDWPGTLRNAAMLTAQHAAIDEAVIDARRKYNELRNDYESMKDMLTDEMRDEFEYELQNLREERRTLEQVCASFLSCLDFDCV